jgi:transcriptional regulator with XRE-family HTH domain
LGLREVFATNLRRPRNAEGLSQDALAYEAQVSRSYARDDKRRRS